jgi:hypothetical protein
MAIVFCKVVVVQGGPAKQQACSKRMKEVSIKKSTGSSGVQLPFFSMIIFIFFSLSLLHLNIVSRSSDALHYCCEKDAN